MHPGLLAALQAIHKKAEREGIMSPTSGLLKPFSAFRTLGYEMTLWNKYFEIYSERVDQVFTDISGFNNDKDLRDYCGGGHESELKSTIERMSKKFGLCKSLNKARQIANRRDRERIIKTVTRGFKAWPPGPHTTGRAVDVYLGVSKPDDTNKRDEMRAQPAYMWLKQNAAAFGLSEYAGTRSGGEPWHWEIHPSNAVWALKTFGLEGSRTTYQQIAVDIWPKVPKEDLDKLFNKYTGKSSNEPK